MLRKTPLKSKKRINRISDKHRKELKQYSQVRRDYMMTHMFCEVCSLPATDIHHKERRGKNLCNPDTFMSVCRTCHMKIESNGKWARENGYTI